MLDQEYSSQNILQTTDLTVAEKTIHFSKSPAGSYRMTTASFPDTGVRLTNVSVCATVSLPELKVQPSQNQKHV